MKTLVVAAAAAFVICGVLSCAAKTDLNTACGLVKKDPNDPNNSVPITESDISANPNRDVISFGAVECEDLVCVHEAGSPLTGNAQAQVTGWCSRACLQGSTNSCPSADPNLDKNTATALSCRALLLDEQTLATLKQTDPQTYKQYFGDTTSPYFCARAVVATSGSGGGGGGP